MGEYPSHLARSRQLADGRSVTIRPIRADDQAAADEFFGHLCGESLRMRFMKFVSALSGRMIHFFTHIDYDRHMAFVCEAECGGRRELVGEARYVANPDGRSCEFGVVVADAWHKTGIAGLLMEALIRYARARGFESMEGLVLRENHDMLKFVRALGFEASPALEEPTSVRVTRNL